MACLVAGESGDGWMRLVAVHLQGEGFQSCEPEPGWKDRSVLVSGNKEDSDVLRKQPKLNDHDCNS